MRLQQITSQNRTTVILEIGTSGDQTLNSETFDTANSLWKVAFSPSPALLKSINSALPPFGLFFSTFAAAILIALYLMIRFRLGRRSLVEAIDLQNTPPNPLTERWKKSAVGHSDNEEPQRGKEPQLDIKPQPSKSQTQMMMLL